MDFLQYLEENVYMGWRTLFPLDNIKWGKSCRLASFDGDSFHGSYTRMIDSDFLKMFSKDLDLNYHKNKDIVILNIDFIVGDSNEEL